MTTASRFDILAAIDLRGGRVVRLRQGDFARETAYGDDPMAVARAFADARASWIHLVDLDGARSGIPVHGRVVAEIVAALRGSVRVEVTGGLRTVDAVRGALEIGAARVVLGTVALADPALAERLVADHGTERVAVAIDVRSGQAVGHGWAEGTGGTDAAQAINRLADVGIATFEVTAIERDGLLAGPDLDLYARMVGLGRGDIIASGGVATVDDLRRLRELGCAGAIVGRALYDGRVTIEQALSLG